MDRRGVRYTEADRQKMNAALNSQQAARFDTLLDQCDRLPVNSDPLAPVLAYDGERKRAWLARCRAHFQARMALMARVLDGDR